MASPTEPGRFDRDVLEFGRAVNFFDATFAIATTLLVTTLATNDAQWSSWDAFRHAIGGPLLAYAVSFLVVSRFWWSNHQFVASLQSMTPKVVGVSVIMLGFVVLLPFSTSGLGSSSGDGQVSTVVYAINVAAVSITILVLQRVALSERVYRTMPTRQDLVHQTFSILDVPIVFLASVPIALFWSADAAKFFWLLLIPLGVFEGRWFAHRRA